MLDGGTWQRERERKLKGEERKWERETERLMGGRRVRRLEDRDSNTGFVTGEDYVKDKQIKLDNADDLTWESGA